MRGAYFQYIKEKGCLPSLDAVGAAKARYAEECELRLARITNGKEPSHSDGHPKKSERPPVIKKIPR